MADISIISRLVAGFQRNVDLAQNALVVGSLKIGSTSPVELTKAIAEKLVAIQSLADADGSFDTRYHTKSALAANTGAAAIGSSTGSTVEARILALEASSGSGAAEDISFDNTASGLTATNVQAAIDETVGLAEAAQQTASDAIPSSEKGAANGVATLGAGGKIPMSQLPLELMRYMGMWDASTNTPELSDATGQAGDVWIVSVAGTVNLGSGNITFAKGDWAVHNGTIFEKSDNADDVVTVNGYTGNVVLKTSDIAEEVNLYFTETRAKDAAATLFEDNASIEFTASGSSVTAEVADGAISAAKLAASVVDGKTISGGAGSALSVTAAPKLESTEVLGEALSAGLVALRFANATEAATLGEGVMLRATNDSTTSDKFDVIGLSLIESAASAEDEITVTSAGDMVVTGHGFPVGAPLFLGVDGVVTATAPATAVGTAIVKVGTVKSANVIRVQIQIIIGG